jgi:hypothetical protein
LTGARRNASFAQEVLDLCDHRLEWRAAGWGAPSSQLTGALRRAVVLPAILFPQAAQLAS